MLTRELAIAAFESGRILPDRLTEQRHGHYLAHAERLLEIYRQGMGRTRRDLHRDVHAEFAAEGDCPIRRLDAFCKLLDDQATFTQDRRGASAALRREVFRRAAKFHPLVRQVDRLFEASESDVKQQIAGELGRSWHEIEAQLFADVIEFQRLTAFKGYAAGRDLLSRYNVAQYQVALFDAVSLRVLARQDLKTILRYAKLARLMHTIRRREDGAYELKFDGAASVLRETRRYGVQMAKFLPALLACSEWKLRAELRFRRRWPAVLELSPQDGLRSHLPPPSEFDSQVEDQFARDWGAEPREGWRLERESEILHQGQHVFLPDFVLRHEDGRVVLLEIVGYWTPEYLEAKRQTLRRFAGQPVLLAVMQSAAQSSTPSEDRTIRFKRRLTATAVLQQLPLAK